MTNMIPLSETLREIDAGILCRLDPATQVVLPDIESVRQATKLAILKLDPGDTYLEAIILSVLDHANKLSDALIIRKVREG